MSYIVVPGNPDPEEAEVKLLPPPPVLLACPRASTPQAVVMHHFILPLLLFQRLPGNSGSSTHAHPLTMFAFKDVSCEVILIFHYELRI